jgi:hypothetical protein
VRTKERQEYSVEMKVKKSAKESKKSNHSSNWNKAIDDAYGSVSDLRLPKRSQPSFKCKKYKTTEFKGNNVLVACLFSNKEDGEENHTG